jgi:peptide/nickel transport system substrate-binding protein
MRSILTLRLSRIAAVAATAAVLLAVGSSTAALATSRKGGVVTWAEAPGAPPTYIFPLENSANFDTGNIYDLAQLLYPELYAYGPRAEPVLSKSLSLADPAVFSDHNTVVTINMKHYVWSDGTPLTARDVIFWMNLLSAVTDPDVPAIGSSSAPGPGWGAEVPGGFPQNVVSYAQTGQYSLVFHLNAAYNPTWYQYNELSQIYPIPQAAWDKLSATGAVGSYDATAEPRILAPGSDGLPAGSYVPANPGTATTGALGVAQFMNLQSEDIATYSTNPLWQVVDGPFKLSQFTPSGFVKFVPNKAYSGSPKPQISAFEEEPYTSETAEFDALRTGSVTIGYIPPQDLSQKASLEKSGYSFNIWQDFGIAFLSYNFTNATSGPIFKQLYFRQAFQSLVNQPEYIKDLAGGIGSIANGPVPGEPVGNPDESPLESKGQVYPYDPAKAVKLLKDNGWTVDPGGTSFCSHPGTGSGECGAGIGSGQTARFSLLYASDEATLTSEMEALQSTSKSKAGIALNLSQAPVSSILGKVYDGCTAAKPCNDWDLDMLDYTFDWVYGPDFFPSGEQNFLTGASSNPGDYSSSTNDANIKLTTTATSHSAGIAALFKYQDYLVKQLPVVWMPNEYSQLTMYKSDLKGVVPQSILDFIFPQYYSFKSK